MDFLPTLWCKDGDGMSEKEAIEILEKLRDAGNSNIFGFSKEIAEINEALTLAIQKLSN